MAKKKVKTEAAKKSKQKTRKRTVRAKSKRATKAKASRRPARPARASASAAPTPAAPRAKGIAAGYNWVNPFLVVRDMERAIDFYRNAFGFQIRNTMPGPDGKLMHAELVHNDSVVMIGPERLDQGVSAPQGVSPVTIYVYVENVDDFASRASTNGGRLIEPPSDRFWGDRCCVIMDTEGHSWMIATHVRDVPPEDMHP